MTVEEVIGTLFQGEDQQLIQSLINISSIKQYSKGQVIYDYGIEQEECYILASGIAYTYLPDKKHQMNTTCFFSEKFDLLNIEGPPVRSNHWENECFYWWMTVFWGF